MSLKNLGFRSQRTALLPLALLSGFTTACNRPIPAQAQASAQVQVQPQARTAEISLPGPNAVESVPFHCTADGNLVYTCTLTEEAKQAYLQAHPKSPKIPAMLPTLMPVPVTLPGLKGPAPFSCARRVSGAPPVETAYMCTQGWR